MEIFPVVILSSKEMDQKIIKFLFPFLIIPFFLILPDRFTPSWIVTDVKGPFSSFNCPEIVQITAQPFRYLGHGLQSIAFVSADGQYVLKFFLKGKLRRGIRFGLKKSPPPNRIRYDLLQRYDEAFRSLREETGLVAVHLAASSDPLPSCTVYDPDSRPHRMDLSRASFVIQRRGIPLNQLSPKEKKKALPLLQQLLRARAKKGFTDSKDRLNENNFALLEERAIMIDLGNVVFSEEQKRNPTHELERVKKLLDNSHSR